MGILHSLLLLSLCCCCSWWHCSLHLLFSMWGFSLLMSDSRTGFRKNSSAPSSRHLIQNIKIRNGSGISLMIIKYHMQLRNANTISYFVCFSFTIFVDIISFDSLFDSVSSQVSLRSPRNRINPGQRRVVLVSCLHQQNLFHGYGNMEDLHDRYAYHHISFSFILYQRCRDYTWTV